MKRQNRWYRDLIASGRRRVVLVIPTIFLILAAVANAQVAAFTKAQVAERIRKVEDGVDEFRKYLETRGDNARDSAQATQNSGKARRGGVNSANAESRQQRARQAGTQQD